MWSKLVLCLLVGLAYASSNPGWKKNHEYVYQVRGRTLTGLNQISNNYTGILLKAKLYLRPKSDGNLGARIENAQYASIHTKLRDGWDQEIPDSELSYQNIPISNEPFLVRMSNNVVTGLVVNRNIKNWEANMIKAVVSQLQLNTEAENLIPSSITILAPDANNAVFKTMEKTVTGETETLYEIHPLPEYVLQSYPWLAPLRHLKGNGEIIEVVKNKNFTHSRESPAYYFGLNGVDSFDINNKIGEFFSRSSVSRAIITGSLKSFTLQSSATVDQVNMQPTMQDQQRGAAYSKVNITLLSMQQQNEDFPEPSSPINVGVVYQYNQPFADSNGPSLLFSRNLRDNLSRSSGSSESNSASNENNRYTNRLSKDRHSGWNSDEMADEPEQYSSVQEKPHITQAPGSPLLPFTVGYDGQAISKKQNIVETVISLAKKIGQEFQDPENMPEKNTVGKFLTLTSLLRVLNEKEIKVVANKLYKDSKQNRNAGDAAWVAYRDAVAQAGTGPALLNIKEWIEEGKLKEKEAAEVIATAANSARQPTEKYMKVFFEMIQDEQMMEQQFLNTSLLLSYSTLCNQVYVNKEDSHSKYPVHSFGSFRTSEGLNFVKYTVISYFTEKLNLAVSNADTKQIHAYIRALGNVGHPNVLQSFKPYLEGDKQVSQFQRVLMVVALDNLVQSYPKAARSVLFKIYQNSHDFEQVRVAAVYQLMRAEPTPAMLQRMAKYTNIDSSNHVNAAVKSVIEAAAELQGAHHNNLRAAAQSAKPLLSSEDFGYQQSQGNLRHFVYQQGQLEYMQEIHTLGGEDSVWPKGINYMLQGKFGGVKQQEINLQSMVSSVEDLVNVLYQQTKQYRQLLREKQSADSCSTKWSSCNTANLLNMKNEQREQLEGNLYMQLESWQQMWSFDNQTIEDLDEIIKDLEQELRNGKQMYYDKMVVDAETAISFPNAWGLPFIYTYDRPILIHVESEMKAIAKPQIYSQEGLQTPETIDAEYKANAFVSGRVQSQLGFFAPFNHKRYSSGYDKNFQVIVPQISGDIKLNVEHKQATIQVENNDNKNNVNLVHYSSWPYTAQYEIDDQEPDTQVIRKENPQRFNTVVGQKSTGIALYVDVTSDMVIDCASMFNKLRQHDLVSAVLGSWLDDNMQHVQINLGIDSDKSTTNKLSVHLGHQRKFTAGLDNKKRQTPNFVASNPTSQESWERQQKFLKKCRENIVSADAQVVDAAVLLQGERIIKYTTTLAAAQSSIDPKGRVIMQVQKDNQQDKPLVFALQANVNAPNPSSLNLNKALDFDATTTIQVQGSIDRKSGGPAQVNAQVTLSQSEQRKQYLKEQQQYEECQKQMEEGNNQLPACAMLTYQANLLDQFKINIDYDNIDKAAANYTYKVYSIMRWALFPRLSENIVVDDQDNQNRNENENRLEIMGQFSPDLSAVNASISSKYGNAEIKNVPLNQWAQAFLVSHPSHQASERLAGWALNYDTVRPTCVVDGNAANTLDNKTFPINLSDEWAVMLQYVPRTPSSDNKQQQQSVTEQLKQQLEEYVVYARATQNNQKEIKMVIQSPYTTGKVIDITLKPSGSSNGYPRLFIQNEEIKYDSQGSHIYDGYMQVYQLPNEELKAEVYDCFNVVYDGERVKLELVNDKFRDASRGLCGTFTDEPETDFTAPSNCIIRNPEAFVAANTVSQKQRSKRMNEMLMIRSEENKCYRKHVEYVKIVSAQDSGLTDRDFLAVRSGTGKSSNLLRRTKYVVLGRETCFSISPLPVCKQGHRELETESQLVSAHCVESSGPALLYRQQIDNGASPSFKNKPLNRKVMMSMAKRCQA